MAPKKAKGKDAKEDLPQVQSFYVKREPLPPPEALDVADAEVAWKGSRNHFVLPLPTWDSSEDKEPEEGEAPPTEEVDLKARRVPKAVDTCEWKPAETETLFTSGSFSTKALGKAFTKDIVHWRRSHVATESTAAEEDEPIAQPLPELEEAPPEPDPKAKAKAKAEAKKPAKGAPPPDANAPKPTAEQFAEIEPSANDGLVVTPAEFRTRELMISIDEGASPLCQAITAQFAIIGEHRRFIPRGGYLWELIYPQDEEGMAIFNPHGKYIVRLFLQGQWRQVVVDDVVPVGIAAPGTGAVHAPMFPAAATPGVIWPQLLTKALLKAYQADLQAQMPPIIMALTGWVPCQMTFNWPSLYASLNTRLFCVFQSNTEQQPPEEAVASSTVKDDNKPGRKGKQSNPEVPALSLASAPPPQTMPKLGSQPCDAAVQFVVCEMVEGPQQVRMKAASWRPAGSTARRVVIKEFDSEVDEDEDEEDDLQRRGVDGGTTVSEVDEQDEEDDEPERSQRSPSGTGGNGDGAGSGAAASARSKEEGENGGDAAAKDATANGDAGDGAAAGEEAAEEVKPECPWPLVQPGLTYSKSFFSEHRNELIGGFWKGADELSELCESYYVYLPPGEKLLCNSLDTCWSRERKDSYQPAALQLLRIRLTAEEVEQEEQEEAGEEELERLNNSEDEVEPTKKERLSPPNFHVVVNYEPLRPDATLGGDRNVSVGPGGTILNCMLQCVSHWKPPQAADSDSGDVNAAGRPPLEALGTAPDYMCLQAGEGAVDWTSSCRSMLLPPGEHWYLVADDAVRAGSVLSVYVDGTNLVVDKSSVQFTELSEAFQELGVPGFSMEPCEYPAQKGFNIWAKAEITLAAELLEQLPYLQLVSNVLDAPLRPFLRATLLRIVMDPEAEKSQRCAQWSVACLASVPLLSMTTLPLESSLLPAIPVGWTAKYVVMVEANTPAPTKAGKFSVRVMLPPAAAQLALSLTPPAPEEGDESEPQPQPFELASLKADHIMRWNGETVPNDHLVVMRERISVPVGAGDVTASIRVTVAGLSSAFLLAKLVVQLPPEQGMRPLGPEGNVQEPIPFGHPIDPKEYGGRLNWLASCRTVVEECGPQVVLMPHVVLCEGSTYRLDVCLDPYRGSDSLEGGSWQLEIHGSGDVEVGADTTEQDLEALVYKSFEDPQQEEGKPTRKETATATRLKWRRDRGLAPMPSDEELAAEREAAAAAAAAAADPKAKAKAKPGKDEPPPVDDAEAVAAAAQAEQEALIAALQRAQAVPHPNKPVADFLHLHSDEPAVLVSEDPWTVAPDAPCGDSKDAWGWQAAMGLTLGAGKLPWAAPEATPENDEYVAVEALSAAALETVRTTDNEHDGIRWEQIQMQMDNAKDEQTQALSNLTAWREEHAVFEMNFLSQRADLQGSLNVRFQKRAALKALVSDPEKIDREELQQALEEAQKVDVGSWDKELLESAALKINLLQAFPALQAEVQKSAEEDWGADPAAKGELRKLALALQGPFQKLQAAKVPICADMPCKEVLGQAFKALQDQPVPAEEEGAEGDAARVSSKQSAK